MVHVPSIQYPFQTRIGVDESFCNLAQTGRRDGAPGKAKTGSGRDGDLFIAEGASPPAWTGESRGSISFSWITCFLLSITGGA